MISSSRKNGQSDVMPTKPPLDTHRAVSEALHAACQHSRRMLSYRYIIVIRQGMYATPTYDVPNQKPLTINKHVQEGTLENTHGNSTVHPPTPTSDSNLTGLQRQW